MPARTQPNLLLICTDQQRSDSLGCYGNAEIQTPALDRLAQEGTRFDAAYAQSPVCAPSRASLMTGLYPHNHGLWANGVALGDQRRLISKSLADMGYDCGLVGKLHLAAAAEGQTEHRFDDGFRVLEWAHDPIHSSPQNAYHRWLAAEHPDVWERFDRGRGAAWESEAGNEARGGLFLDGVRAEAHYSTWVAERSIAFLQDPARGEDEPFFLIANFFDPHHPFGAPPEYLERYEPEDVPAPVGSPEDLRDRPDPLAEYSRTSYAGTAPGFADYSAVEIRELIVAYYAMVTLIDDQVARILEALENSGRARDTLVVFMSDHGEMLGDHGILLKGPMMYEGAVRVPLIVRWPGHVRAGACVDDLVQLIDVTSTLLAAAGCRAHPDAQGSDLVALAAGRAAPRGWALAEYRDAGFPNDPAIHTTMLRSGRYKLVVWHGEPATPRPRQGELYDLDADPDELRNLWDDPGHQSIRTDLVAQLLDTFAATEDRSAPRMAMW